RSRAASAAAVVPACRAPDGSATANASGRKTDRIPCASHLSGNSDDRSIIQPGSWLTEKNTPDVNCSTSSGVTTTALADRPDRGTDEYATPHTAPVAVPSTNTHANVAHRAGSSGRGTSKTSAATARSSAVCTSTVVSERTTLPRKYDAGGSGVARSRLRLPSSRSAAIEIASVWYVESMMPVATMPGRKYCAKPTLVPSTAIGSSSPKTVEKIASMTIG